MEAYEIDESYWQEIEYDETVLCEYDWDIDNFDRDAVYYNGDEEVAGNPAVEVKVFDEAYAAYLDARKRFNGIMLARGYLPIVALTNFHTNLIPGLSSMLSSSLPGSSGKGKGSKGKGFKRKSNSKDKNIARYPQPPPKEADPHSRAQSALVITYLRCRQPGHITINCPLPRSSASSPAKKRAAPTASTAIHLEQGMVTFQNQHGHEYWDCVMLDPGSSAFSMGYGSFLR